MVRDRKTLPFRSRPAWLEAGTALVLLIAPTACSEPATTPVEPAVCSCSPADAGQPPGLFFGTYASAMGEPESFVGAADGSTMSVIIGPQGSEMVVLAVAVAGVDCCLQRVDTTVQVVSQDGHEWIDVPLTNRRLRPGPDGLSYIAPLWIIFDSSNAGWDKTLCTLRVTMKAPGGGQPVITREQEFKLERETYIPATPLDPSAGDAGYAEPASSEAGSSLPAREAPASG